MGRKKIVQAKTVLGSPEAMEAEFDKIVQAEPIAEPIPENIRAMEPGFDEMGQPLTAVRGEPDTSVLTPPAHMSDAEGNKVPVEEPAKVVEESPIVQKEENPADFQATDDEKAQILKMVSDPDVAMQLARTVAATPEGRKLFEIKAGQGAPAGHYQRDYTREPQLRVTGGLEVAHDAEMVPRPPAYIPCYEAEHGRTTDNVEMALKDGDGNPIKTERFRHWLDMKMEGKHLDGRVRADMANDTFVSDDIGVPI